MTMSTFAMINDHNESTSDVFKLRRGNSKLIVSMPHVGTQLPESLNIRMTKLAKDLPDTDWYLEELYDFLKELDVTVIAANYSRYVVDLNRSADDMSLYPGSNVTGLCPIDTFSGELIYQQEMSLDATEIKNRLKMFWHPYHDALTSEIARVKALHGDVIVWDAHSIRSVVPRFFDGELPQLNIGTADGTTCQPKIIEKALSIIKSYDDYSWVDNGRFKGGFITRHYGQPSQGINAIQLEIAMRSYMDESSSRPKFDNDKAQSLRVLLKSMMQSIIS
jgi:N-formylglutamate deformylase